MLRSSRLVASVALPLVTLALALGAVGCSSADADASQDDAEGALERAGHKVLARNLQHPAGLAVTDEHVYFSVNNFVASGDPELDQQFAYWEGKYSRVPVGGGARQKVSDAGITRVRVSGKKLFVATGSSCWISVINTASAALEQKGVFTAEECSGEGGGEPAGFETTRDKFIVVREGGEVMVGSLAGENMRKVGEFRFGDYAGFITTTALAGDHVYALTPKNYTDHANNRTLPQTIFKLPIAGGAPSKAIEFPPSDAQVESMTTDGKNVLFTAGKKLFALVNGEGQPKLLDEDFGYITDVVSNGKDVFVADSKRDALYVVKDAFGTPRHVKLLDAKGISQVALGGNRVYYATHAVSGNKAAGIVASLPIPE